MIGEQRPRQDREASLRSDRRQPVDPILPIHVISKDGSSLDSPHHDMVQGTRRIQARPTRHGKTVAPLTVCCQDVN